MTSTKPNVGQNIGIFAIFALYGIPLLLVVLASFKSDSDVVNNPSGLIFVPTLSAYEAVFNPALLTAMGNSFLIAGSSTLLTLVAATPLAFVLARTRGALTGIVIGLLIALQMLPAATAVIPQFRVLAGFGLLNSIAGVVLAMSATALPTRC